MEAVSHLFSILVLALALFSQQATTCGAMNMTERNRVKGIIGAIVDCSSRIGKEEKLAMEMAIEDFFDYTNQSLVLQVKNSHGEPIQAALAATHLINTQHVQAILGPRKWEEASLVAEIGTQSHTPILSFADSTPPWATVQWPFLIQASPSQHAQMKAVASIVQSWGWRRVILINEDTDSAANGAIPHLYDSILEVGAEISHLVALPPSASSSSLSEELEKLNNGQCRVFVVHTSLPLAIRLFEKAKKMEMMEKGYVWITTEPITSLVHTINSSAISSMQGILGVKSYFLETGPRFHDFYGRFTRKFSLEHPEEKNHEPGIFAVQAYDATRAVALEMAEGNKRGRDLLDKILLSDFDGLSGKFLLTDRKLAPARTFQIVNVIGKSYRELGFWSDGFGFSGTVDGRATYNDSMENLGQVLWPGEPRSTPKGWTVPTLITNKLRIGVPNRTLFNLYLTVVHDQLTNSYAISGFSIDVFKATVEHLPYDLPYDLIPFGGTFDALVEQVYLKNFDAVVGAVAITSRRYKHADFSHPYSDSSLVMVVPLQSQFNAKAGLFLKPFTTAMWVLIAVINVYNGLVIWMIERDHCSELRGSALNQIGTLLWLAFSTLFSLHGEKLHSNLSRMAMVVWLFVALAITQSYMANLTSMLTVPRLEPTVTDIETLKYNNAMVGCTTRSFAINYLTDVLNFSSNYMKKDYNTPEELAQALRIKEIAAAFLDAPLAKLFVAKYCKSFVIAGPSYKIGGYGFVFPKGSPMLSDINEALLQVVDSGMLQELDKSVTTTESCVDVESDEYNNVGRLSPNSFWILFMLAGGTSTVALVTYVILGKCKFEHITIWKLMFAVMKCWWHQKNRLSGRVSDAGSPRAISPPNPSDSRTQV